MCGIAGMIDFHGRPIDSALLEQTCAALGHRGPDDRGTWIHQSPGFTVGLAHTRLAVIDPAPEGHQPMLDPSGRWAIVYNGELYNYQALRSELSGPFRTESDTEVVLQSCREWGPEALRRFDAMWALAVVDVQERRGYLSRDPFGIKPLYYAVHDGRLIFASEMATLRRVPGLPLEIDRQALALYLHLGFIPHPYTIYRTIRKLPPGHLLEFEARGPLEPRRYHRLAVPQEPVPDYTAACRELRGRIESAVVAQRIADVPLGAFLSGGLDSSIVVACLARAGGERVKTFSIGYAEHAGYDETSYARLAAEHFHTEHHAFRLSFGDVLAGIEPLLNHLGEPFADSSLLPTALVSAHTRRHVTVALSGDGGDEVFGGYWRYLGHHYLERYRKIPALLRKGLIEPLLKAAPSAKSTRALNRVRQAQKLLRGDVPGALDRHLAWARYVEPGLAASLLGIQTAHDAAQRMRSLYAGAAADLAGRDPCEPLEEILLADLAVGLPADMLYKVDTASMFHSLEVRVPLLSKEVVDFAAGLPVEYRIAGGQGKRILRDAFRGIIPDAILNRPKMGFEVPIGEFLRNELRDLFHDVVTARTLGDLGLEVPAAQQAYQDHAARRADHADLLWALLVLCWWCRGSGHATGSAKGPAGL